VLAEFQVLAPGPPVLAVWLSGLEEIAEIQLQQLVLILGV